MQTGLPLHFNTAGATISCVAKERATALQYCAVYLDSYFLPGQLESALPALHGRDDFVLMATGAGKSLAMFLVPLAYSDLAVGIIISPDAHSQSLAFSPSSRSKCWLELRSDKAVLSVATFSDG